MKPNCEENLKKKRGVHAFKSHNRHWNNHNKINESPSIVTRFSCQSLRHCCWSYQDKPLYTISGDLSDSKSEWWLSLAPRDPVASSKGSTPASTCSPESYRFAKSNWLSGEQSERGFQSGKRKKIWAHSESAVSGNRMRPTCLKVPSVPGISVERPLLLTLTIKQDTLLTVDTASCHC